MSASARSLIQLDDVKKIFYTDEVETHALSGVHMDIKDGEYISIAGPSGCGKSTLLSILGLLDSPSEGSYQIKGQPVESLDPAERARIRNREIGFIFQSFNLIGDLTVYENVELPLTYRGMSAAERKQTSHGGAGKSRDGASGETSAESTVGRSAAASGGGACRGRAARYLAGGRADWEPGFDQRRGGDGALAGVAQGRRDHLHGDARPKVRPPRRPNHTSLRRARRRGGARAVGRESKR